MIVPNNNEEILWNKYNSLPADIRFFADIAILLFEPVNYFQFEDLIRNLKIKNPPKSYFQVYSALNKAGVTNTSDYNVLAIHSYIVVKAFPELYRKNEYIPYISQIQKFSLQNLNFHFRPVSPLRFLRNFIIGCFEKDKAMMEESVKFMNSDSPLLRKILVQMLFSGLYDDVLLKLPTNFHHSCINGAIVYVVYQFNSREPLYLFIDKLTPLEVTSPHTENYYNGILAALKLFEGKFTEALDVANKYPSTFSDYVIGICSMYNGDLQTAKNIFYNQILLFRRKTGQRKYFPDIHFGFFYLLLLSVHQPGSHNTELAQLEKLFLKSDLLEDKLLLSLINNALGRKYEAKIILSKTYFEKIYTSEYLDVTIYLIIVFILEGKLTDEQIVLAKQLYDIAISVNQLLYAHELGWILNSQNVKHNKLILKDYQPLLSSFVKNEAWDDMLTSLLAISGNGSNVKKDKMDGSRLIYLVDFDARLVQSVLQTRIASGWSKGRNVSLKKLKNGEVDCLTPQDLKIVSTIEHNRSYYGVEYSFDFDKVLNELAGHPLLFYYANPEIPVELIRTPPELIIEKTAKGYKIQCNVGDTGSKQVLLKETNTRYKYVELTEEQLLVIRALTHGMPLIPVKGKDKLFKTLAHVSSFMTVHSDSVIAEENIKSVQADSRVRVQILPVGGSLKAECFVKPFGTVPPYSKPGKGGKTVYGIIENEKCIVNRNLEQELANVITLANAVSEIADADLITAPVMFSDPHECLSLLEVLRSHQEIAVVEWPEGERFRVRQSLSFQQLQLKVNSRGNWFELSGELKLDENRVLTLQQLLSMRTKSKGRFVEIGDNEFVALSEELKKRLDELAIYSSIDKKEIKVNKFASHALEEITQNAGSFKTDKAWKEFQKKIKITDNLIIGIPTTLEAELRPYQEEGFRWMARLAAWDAGACLADDMGLGKTVQALTLLLHRAAQGSALVVCPASVVNNWVTEARKFVPTLNVSVLPVTNREEILENLKEFDLLIITYGILQTVNELLGKITWNTVILDEAHAVKNNNTKTSKAAMNLQANFRLILTGTPVQNHLGELWNLFNFINPGLLGTYQQFNERFMSSGPDEVLSEKQYLKKLISPFMLRRTKAKVLDELPPKTEITHLIELSEDEKVFYEALRRQAIASIESDEGPSGQKHLKALAEITRLRLACCNVSLVDNTQKLASAKLDTFFEIVDELLENKHRALVFSQFIGHLNIVRKAIEKRNISYQYLDGSTPIPERAVIVKNFQEGSGDLFLISLKAGGLGLNLTGADYVIHLDPWWNPAIEDQASDRAHRIGQTRPVTIYRLVAKDTIEEKIIRLHHTKRDMADSLLEGTDQAAKLSTNDLLNLLKEL